VLAVSRNAYAQVDWEEWQVIFSSEKWQKNPNYFITNDRYPAVSGAGYNQAATQARQIAASS
jgi:hypothetical protein